MKATSRLPRSTILVSLLVFIAIAGMGASIALTTDSYWVNWHMSRLGEGHSTASMIFNASLIAGAILLLLVSEKIRHEHWLAGKTTGMGTFSALVSCVAMGWVGVALFPFDDFPVIHNIFGYGMFVSACILMLGLTKISPHFSRRTYAIGTAAVLVTGIMMALHHLVGLTSLLVVELIGEAMLFAWLFSVASDSSKLSLTRSRSESAILVTD